MGQDNPPSNYNNSFNNQKKLSEFLKENNKIGKSEINLI